MYKPEINTRDLFYSNPADHFLKNDPKTSVESGFSSSFGYSHSGNSKERLNSTSQDLFNLTPKISGCEGQTSSTDYHKYISQNLFSKVRKTPSKFSFGRNENQRNDEEKHSLKTTENQNDFDEIKALLGNSLEGIRKLNNDMSDVKHSIKDMEFEISKQNERIGSFEELFYKQEKMIEELNENCKKLNKKEDDNLTKIQKTLNESVKEIKKAVDKVKSAMEANQAKIVDKIKKNSTPQPSMDKKLSEQAKRNNEQFMRNIEIKINDMHTAFETYLMEIKNYYEEKLHENIDDLKTLINSSNSKLRAMISSQKVNGLKTGLYRNFAGAEAAQQNEPDTFGSTRSGFFSRPLSLRSISNLNPNYEWRNNNPSSYQNSAWSSSQRSAHTPLADIINRNKKISSTERYLKGKDESPFTVKKADISPNPSPPKRRLPRACKQNYFPMNFKRRISTPLLQTYQPMKNLKKSANLNISSSGNKVNDGQTSPIRSRQLGVNTTRAETTKSSSHLTQKNYSQKNFKRKIKSPMLQKKQPMRKNLKKSANLNTSFSGSEVNGNKTPPMRSRQLHVNTTRAETTMSSPYLTLYETMMAEKFTFI